MGTRASGVVTRLFYEISEHRQDTRSGPTYLIRLISIARRLEFGSPSGCACEWFHLLSATLHIRIFLDSSILCNFFFELRLLLWAVGTLVYLTTLGRHRRGRDKLAC